MAVELPKPISEVLSGEMEVGPDSSIRYAQLLSNLTVLPSFQVVKKQYFSPDIGQPVQAIGKLFPDLQASQVTCRSPGAR
jgi:hypothetical protein